MATSDVHGNGVAQAQYRHAARTCRTASRNSSENQPNAMWQHLYTRSSTKAKADFTLTSGTTASGGAPSQLTSTYLTRLLETNQIQAHIKDVLQPAYASRYKNLIQAIEAHLLPLGFDLPQPGREVVGGYFVWLSLPEGLTASELARRCKEDQELIIAPGPIFEVPGDSTPITFDGHVRLCFAYVPEEDLEEGVERMGVVAKNMLDERREKPSKSAGQPDTVPQALARKAFNDPELKALMKVVATGAASPDDMSRFQKHIDALGLKRASSSSADDLK